MSIRALVLALALVPGLVAGCVGKETPAAEDELVPASDAEPATESPAVASPTPASPTPAQTSPSPSPTTSPSPPPSPTPAPAADPDEPAPPAGPETVLLEGDFSANAMATDAKGARVYSEDEPAVLDLPRAFPRNATLVATWTADVPTGETLYVFLHDAEGNLVGGGTGASPLVVEIPGEAFANATKIEGRALPEPSPAGPSIVPMAKVHFALNVTYA